MAYNQQLSVLGQVAPATTGTAGQVLVSAGSSASSYWASAIPVSAYSAEFNGSNYLSFTDSTLLSFGTGDFTVECWVYKTSALNGSIIDARTTLTGIPWCAYIDASNFPYLYIGSSLTSSISITNNAWNHVVWTRISGIFKIYVNGVQGYSAALATNLDRSGTVTIGGTAAYTTGYISNLRVVKGLAVYTGAFTPPTSPLGTAQGAGTNIAAVTASQTSLLTCNGPGFTDSSPNAFAITNNGNAITSQYAPFSSFSAIAKSATQTQTILTSGSGTYYTPSGVAWLRIRMVGGGGGGGGGGGSGSGNGAAGANTTFGSSFLNSVGGTGGYTQNGPPGIGGTATIGSGATGVALSGGGGQPAAYSFYPGGGNGGASPFGGAGAAGYPNGDAGNVGKNGYAGATNSGSGGGGGKWNVASNAGAGSGGAAGGYIEAYISSPAASYAYTIGTAGGGGTAGSSGGAGGGGGSGVIIVEENYAVSVVKKSMTQTILTSGSGTYTTPIGVVQLEIRMVGGGGGGGGGAFGTVGSNGGSTTFGTSLLTATGGIGADRGSVAMSVGGTGTISGATGVTFSGGSGTPGAYGNSVYYPQAGNGGNTPFGGGGGGSSPTGGALFAGVAGATNSGAGGAGGHSTAYNWAGHGGGGAGYVEAYISNPAASYAYAVGAGGGGGAAAGAGSSNGGGGGSGIIIIKEYY